VKVHESLDGGSVVTLAGQTAGLVDTGAARMAVTTSTTN